MNTVIMDLELANGTQVEVKVFYYYEENNALPPRPELFVDSWKIISVEGKNFKSYKISREDADYIDEQIELGLDDAVRYS